MWTTEVVEVLPQVPYLVSAGATTSWRLAARPQESRAVVTAPG